MKFAERLEKIRPEMMKYTAHRLKSSSLVHGGGQAPDGSYVEDIVQDTLMKLWRARHDYDESRNFKRWAMTFLINTIRNFWRDLSDKEHLFDHSASENAEVWLTTTDDPSDLSYPEVKEAVRELAEEYPRRALILVEKYWRGRTDASIGEDLGLTKQRVHQLRQDAERRLREGLDHA